MTTDSISDLIIRLKNASLARKDNLTISYSKLKASIADVLVKEGFIKTATKKGKKVQKSLEIELAYTAEGKPALNDVERVSKVSKRMYYGVSEIRPVRQGFGKLILSTPKGILTGDQARKEKVGGEPLFKIW